MDYKNRDRLLEYIAGAGLGGAVGLIGLCTDYLPSTIVGSVLFLIFAGLTIDLVRKMEND